MWNLISTQVIRYLKARVGIFGCYFVQDLDKRSDRMYVFLSKMILIVTFDFVSNEGIKESSHHRVH